MDRKGRLHLSSSCPRMNGEHASIRRAVNELVSLVLVEIAGRDDRAILGQEERGTAAEECSRFHQNRGALVAEVPKDLHKTTAVAEEQLKPARPFPGESQGSGMDSNVKWMRVSRDLRLNLEAGTVAPPAIPEPEESPNWRTAAPEAVLVEAGMTGFLIEPSLLCDGDPIGIGQ
ncbi:MAG: hypothetical protein U0794_05380 [Isosphaeraceae bacterium]